MQRSYLAVFVVFLLATAGLLCSSYAKGGQQQASAVNLTAKAGSTQTALSQEGSPGRTSRSSRPLSNVTESKHLDSARDKDSGNAKQGQNKKSIQASHTSGFIPPPPPTVPVSGELSPLTGAVDFISLTDLKRRQTELYTEISEAKKNIVDKEKSADDKRQRSTLFASLYTEGVVSRRELEGSQREDSDAQTDLQATRRRLEDLQNELSEIDARIKRLSKSASSKPSRTSHQKDEKPKEKK